MKVSQRKVPPPTPTPWKLSAFYSLIQEQKSHWVSVPKQTLHSELEGLVLISCLCQQISRRLHIPYAMGSTSEGPVSDFNIFPPQQLGVLLQPEDLKLRHPSCRAAGRGMHPLSPGCVRFQHLQGNTWEPRSVEIYLSLLTLRTRNLHNSFIKQKEFVSPFRIQPCVILSCLS